MHILDRPIWSALTTRHAPLAEGNAREAIELFGALLQEEPANVPALAGQGRSA